MDCSTGATGLEATPDKREYTVSLCQGDGNDDIVQPLHVLSYPVDAVHVLPTSRKQHAADAIP
jgi:hypothetical protein